MRNALKALLARSFSRIDALKPQVRSLKPLNPNSFPRILGRHDYLNPRSRCFSSEPATDLKNHTLIADISAKQIGSGEIKAELESLNLSLDDEAVNTVLRSLEGKPEIARTFFDWVSNETNHQKLRSESHNIMLEILGRKGHEKEFWSLVEIMKKKGYLMTKATYSKVSESFKSDEMESDLNELNKLHREGVVRTMCPIVCKILREEEDAFEFEKKLQDLNISFFPDLVTAILEKASSYPKKALAFFHWVEKGGSPKIDARIYNSMARVLGREDCIEEFWDTLDKMRNDGFELEMKTYVTVLKMFYKTKIAAAVDLYKFAMDGSNKPSFHDFVFLVKKIVTRKDLDTDLLSRTFQIYSDAGNPIRRSVYDSVVKSLRSVGRLGECNEILKAMEKGGFVADNTIHNRVVGSLCDAKRLSEACEYIEGLEKAGLNPDLRSWVFLVQKHSLAGEVDEALSCFRNMVERKGGENAGGAFEVLVNGFCQHNKVEDAFKVLREMVAKKNLKPWHSTYKFLIERLLSKGKVKEASIITGLMKNHGFPYFIDPFISYISKSGTEDDAMIFLKSITVKEFPSKKVLIPIFESLLKAGKHDLAHNILSKTPGSVRNHADVLNLFFSMKPDETVIATPT